MLFFLNEVLNFENIFNELCLRYSETFFDEEISTNLIEELDIQNKYKVEKWFDSYAMFNQNKEEMKKDNKVYKNIWISNDRYIDIILVRFRLFPLKFTYVRSYIRLLSYLSNIVLFKKKKKIHRHELKLSSIM